MHHRNEHTPHTLFITLLALAVTGPLLSAFAEVRSYTLGIDVNCPSGLGE